MFKWYCPHIETENIDKHVSLLKTHYSVESGLV